MKIVNQNSCYPPNSIIKRKAVGREVGDASSVRESMALQWEESDLLKRQRKRSLARPDLTI
jgi:hypothetical protein